MKRSHAVIFISAGFLAAAWMLISQYLFCLDMWNNDYKAQAYATFQEYFISVSGGAIMYAAMMAFMPPFLVVLVGFLNRLVSN